MLYLIILIVVVVLFFVLRKRYKLPNLSSFNLVTGAVKSGKTAFALSLALKAQKKRQLTIDIDYYFISWYKRFCFKRPKIKLYSNIPLAVPYVPLTKNLLLRKARFEYNSVIFVDESSLLADSQLIKDIDVNNRLLLFNKLIGHETCGGCIIYNTQSIEDLHYSIKRCLVNYYFVYNCVKLPFGLVKFKVRELYAEGLNVTNVALNDVEDSLKVCITKNVFKKYDPFSFSSLTDDLPVENTEVFSNDLKLSSDKILSFRDWDKYTVKGGEPNEKD